MFDFYSSFIQYIYACTVIWLQDPKIIQDLQEKGEHSLDLRTVTICSGLDLVNITYTPMVCSDPETAKQWFEGLRQITLNTKANNVCPMTQLKKQYVSLVFMLLCLMFWKKKVKR